MPGLGDLDKITKIRKKWKTVITTSTLKTITKTMNDHELIVIYFHLTNFVIGSDCHYIKLKFYHTLEYV